MRPRSQLQGTMEKIASDNGTAVNGTETATGADEVNPVPRSNVTFEDFAGGLLCRNGQKFANCSGVNPCNAKKCFPGTMCMVDMCGACSAKCVSYAEIGAGLNKLLTTVGLGGEWLVDSPRQLVQAAVVGLQTQPSGRGAGACADAKPAHPQASRPTCPRPTCPWWTT